MTNYADFQVVLDEPTAYPGLGFDAYAAALADLITHSDPRFAIGIFGGWGSGKTSLMKAIQRRLEQKPTADGDAASSTLITVWFNPWRYEREEHLIVPMLDTLREALVEWSKSQPEGDLKQRASKAASTVGRAARALLAGFALKAKPLVFEASIDAGKVIDTWQQSQPDDPIYERAPQSFYHASFLAMQRALEAFLKGGPADQSSQERAHHRIVIFVDDLDRCLDEHALEVLESMKLFFDLEGFIFVVGLDQDVVARVVANKFGTSIPDPKDAHVRGVDYIKKIFQVPFTVPPIRPDRLAEYVNAIVYGANLGPEQATDFSQVVMSHLRVLTAERSLNPREVKRFLNAYTLQMKMLSAQPALTPDFPNPDAAMAVQAMAFRRDWEPIYKALLADPDAFGNDLEAALQDGFWPDRNRTAVPPSFLEYAEGAGAVVKNTNLEPYISSVESTISIEPFLAELARAVRDVWRAWGALTQNDGEGDDAKQLTTSVSLLASHLGNRQSAFWAATSRKVADLSAQMARVPAGGGAALKTWSDRFSATLQSLEEDLDQQRQITSIGPTA